MKILCMSDLHLSEHRPQCRIDPDWVDTQQKHLDYVNSEARTRKVDGIVMAGDIFDRTVVHPKVVNMVVDFLLQQFAEGRFVVCIAGNHDAYMHNSTRLEQSSFGAISLLRESLLARGCTSVLGFDFSIEPPENAGDILVLHSFAVEQEKDRPPMRDATTADELLARYPRAQYIITGDNHVAWCHEIEAGTLYSDVRHRAVINCGTLIQRTAAEAKRPCGFWILDDDHESIEHVDLSFLSEGMIDTTYLENIREMDGNRQQYEALVSELRNGEENRYDFVAILGEYMEVHRKDMEDSVYDILMKTIEYLRSI